MGKQAFKLKWASKLSKFERVLVCFDPDAREQATATAQLFGKRGRIVELPYVKADDFFTRYGGSKEDFLSHLANARPVM